MIKAVLGGASQRDRAERSRAAGHLHRQRRKRGSVCVQGDGRQHRTPGPSGVRRSAPGGTDASGVTPQTNTQLASNLNDSWSLVQWNQPAQRQRAAGAAGDRAAVRHRHHPGAVQPAHVPAGKPLPLGVSESGSVIAH